jgi:hypothetical protein
MLQCFPIWLRRGTQQGCDGRLIADSPQSFRRAILLKSIPQLRQRKWLRFPKPPSLTPGPPQTGQDGLCRTRLMVYPCASAALI